MTKATYVRCPYGCGRSILAKRLADHALISAAEHEFDRITNEEKERKVKEAYEYLVAQCATA